MRSVYEVCIRRSGKRGRRSAGMWRVNRPVGACGNTILLCGVFLVCVCRQTDQIDRDVVVVSNVICQLCEGLLLYQKVHILVFRVLWGGCYLHACILQSHMYICRTHTHPPTHTSYTDKTRTPSHIPMHIHTHTPRPRCIHRPEEAGHGYDCRAGHAERGQG